jgi:molecular chaperone DnaK
VDIHVMQGEREFASGNITLGRFQLTGIPPAPRGIPQIEVAFDIDANGIVNVSAKDLGTGKEQSISITSSNKLSEDEIKAKVKEAEQFADEDKKRKSEVETRNQAEALMYETEKAMKELEGKISDDEKSRITAAKDELKSALEGTDIEAVKTRYETLLNEFSAVSQKLYQQAQAQGAAPEQTPGADGFGTGAASPGSGTGSSAAGGDNVVDADFEVVDDDADADEKE